MIVNPAVAAGILLLSINLLPRNGQIIVGVVLIILGLLRVV